MKASQIIELLKTFDPDSELDISISRSSYSKVLDIPIIIKQQDSLEDWYRVERKEHSELRWQEYDPNAPNAIFHCDSARLAPRHCVEGSKQEMIALCQGILANQEDQFKRCAISLQYPNTIGFWSPRQGERSMVYISIEQAKKAAREFLQQVNQDD